MRRHRHLRVYGPQILECGWCETTGASRAALANLLHEGVNVQRCEVPELLPQFLHAELYAQRVQCRGLNSPGSFYAF
jgi:hypothetical protein